MAADSRLMHHHDINVVRLCPLGNQQGFQHLGHVRLTVFWRLAGCRLSSSGDGILAAVSAGGFRRQQMRW